MHEDLLGYLLGALSAEEQSRIESELAQNPRLRAELERLRRCLQPLADLQEAADADPPAGLADRVWAVIDAQEAAYGPTPRSLAAARAAAGVRLQHYSIFDSIALTLIVLAAFTLILPALVNSRYQARKVACQDRLRVLGEGLLTYSMRSAGQRFPLVPISGSRSFAGVFAPILFEYEMIGPDGTQVVCPGSELATELAVNDTSWSVPTLQEIDRAERLALRQLQNRAGGSYAYCVGYLEDGRVQAVRNRSRANYALLSDAPSYYLPGRLSANHGGRGQNVYFEDGHYAFVTDLRFVAGADDPLRNRDGFAEAGRDPFDSVVLPSGMRPIVDPGEMVPFIAPQRR